MGTALSSRRFTTLLLGWFALANAGIVIDGGFLSRAATSSRRCTI